MTCRLAAAALCFAALLLAPALRAQQPDPEIRILSPADGQYVTGPWVLRASVVPLPSVPVRLSFFADKRLVCVVERAPFECQWNAGQGLKAHQIRVEAQLATGRRLRPAVANTKEVDITVNVDRVRLTVSVTDHGRYVDGLPIGAFKVYEDEALQRVSLFLPQNVPLELVVAVDISGSMTEAMPAVRDAAKQFVAALRPSDRVSALGFNSDPFVLFGPDADLDAKRSAIDLLEPWGMTALYDVLGRSLDTLDAAAAGRDSRRALVAFTDGDDTFSHLSQKEIEERAERSEASLYLIAQGAAVQSYRLRQLLERLAEKSGGRAFFPENVNKLPGVFAEIVEDLAHQYLLGYEPNGDDYRWHKVRVTVQDGNYKVRHRQGRRRALPGKK